MHSKTHYPSSSRVNTCWQMTCGSLTQQTMARVEPDGCTTGISPLHSIERLFQKQPSLLLSLFKHKRCNPSHEGSRVCRRKVMWSEDDDLKLTFARAALSPAWATIHEFLFLHLLLPTSCCVDHFLFCRLASSTDHSCWHSALCIKVKASSSLLNQKTDPFRPQPEHRWTVGRNDYLMITEDCCATALHSLTLSLSLWPLNHPLQSWFIKKLESTPAYMSTQVSQPIHTANR